MPDHAELVATILIQAGVGLFVVGMNWQKVRELMKWRERDADPMLDQHEIELHKHDKRITVLEEWKESR